MAPQTILLIGASGFVGRHAAIALGAAGYVVRAASRDPRRAQRKLPWLDFTACDVTSEASLASAMRGCHAAVYLYHGLGTGPDYPETETKAAQAVSRAARRADLARIVYLGGVEPEGPPSRHLASRLRTGRCLREGEVPTVELRAAMVIGHQSQSFTLVRDLVLRTPWLMLPAWLDFRSCPIAICDVAAALAVAVGRPLQGSAWYDLRGPECLTHRELLERLGRAFGTGVSPRRLPGLTPSIATLGLSVLTRVPSSVVAELVEGLSSDLVPKGENFFRREQVALLRSVHEAIADSFADELDAPRGTASPSASTRARIESKTRRFLAIDGCAGA